MVNLRRRTFEPVQMYAHEACCTLVYARRMTDYKAGSNPTTSACFRDDATPATAPIASVLAVRRLKS